MATKKDGKKARSRQSPQIPPPLPSGVQYNCSVRLDLNEITQRMSAGQIHALMNGIALVVNANPYR